MRPIAELGAEIRSGRSTALDLTQEVLSRVDAVDKDVHAFTYIDRNRALEIAAKADRELAEGHDRGPLHGIPYALKDIFDVAGMATQCGSKLSDPNSKPTNSHVQHLLANAGGVLIGKTTTHEFALGGPCFDLPFPPARNPYDLSRFTGGSSSGSAVAVASGMVPLAIGSDTSGSIRGPASYCGVTGLKPTFGLISRRGTFPLSYSLDHIGPMTWDVESAAIALTVLAGFDSGDQTSVQVSRVDYESELGDGLAGLRVGYLRSFFADDADGSLLAEIDLLAQNMALAGADVTEVSLPSFDLFSACGRVIMIAEGYTIHEENLRKVPEEFGGYTYQRLIGGAAITAADYIQAQRLRGELSRAVNLGPLGECDVLLCGSTMGPAPLLSTFGRDWAPYTTMRTIPFSVSGNPAIVLPIGSDAMGLPRAVQLVGRLFEEVKLLHVAYAVEELYSEHRLPIAELGRTDVS